jgi:hypothetical protein
MSEPSTRRKSLSLAHLSDIHIEPDGPAAEAFAACLRRVQEHPAAPELILGGGDYLMDGVAAPRERVRAQWDLWQQVLRDHCRFPWVHCLGNHDVFGWNHAASGADFDTPGYGKSWALKALGLKRRYYSVDRAGWHFVVLDSIHPWGRPGAGFSQALLGQEQVDWLAADLAEAGPDARVLILSHHPIRSSIGYHATPPRPKGKDKGDWTAFNAWLHIDAEMIEDAILPRGNVRLCLNAHMHRRDRAEHKGIVHFGSGAVCGDLWRAPNPDYPASCAIVTLYDDGTFDHEWLDL